MVQAHGIGRTLEVGAGEGDQVVALAWRGFDVTVVESGEMDIPINPEINGRKNIGWRKSKVEDWIVGQEARDSMFVGILASNIIHLLAERFVVNKFAPYCAKHLVSGGVLGIQAITGPVEFSMPVPKRNAHTLESYWPEHRIRQLFSEELWTIEIESSVDKRIKWFGPMGVEMAIPFASVLATRR